MHSDVIMHLSPMHDGGRLHPSAPARSVTLGIEITAESQRDSWHVLVSETGTEEAKTVQSAPSKAYIVPVSPVQRKRSNVHARGASRRTWRRKVAFTGGG